MYFKNERHKQAFREGMKKTNRKDRETVSAVYLLSAEPHACGGEQSRRRFTEKYC